MQVFKKIDKRQESFLANTDNSLAVFVVSKWDRIFESAVCKWEVKCNVKLRPNYFSVNFSVLAVVFRQQIKKNPGNFA